MRTTGGSIRRGIVGGSRRREAGFVSRARPSVDLMRGGAYLTDGAALYRVLPEGRDGAVLLENCRWPDLPPQELAVGEVVAKFRVVRPA